MKQHKIQRLCLAVILLVFASAFAAFAAAGASWEKVKLTKKCVAQWKIGKETEIVKRDIDHYELIVYVSRGNGWQEWDLIETEGNVRHEKLAVTEDGTYKYKVRARMNDGSWTEWSQESNEVQLTDGKGKNLNRTKKNKNAGSKKNKNGNQSQNQGQNGNQSQNNNPGTPKARTPFKKDGSLKKGWEQVDGIWTFYDKDGRETTGWLYVKGHWYYLDDEGEMLTGWIRNDGKIYYLDENGAMVTGDVNIEGTGHSFDASGAKTDAAAVEEPEIEDTENTSVTVGD